MKTVKRTWNSHNSVSLAMADEVSRTISVVLGSIQDDMLLTEHLPASGLLSVSDVFTSPEMKFLVTPLLVNGSFWNLIKFVIWKWNWPTMASESRRNL